MQETKGILTIAIGKRYAKQAKHLAISCMHNSPHTLRAVITDLPDLLNKYYDIIIPYNTNDDPFSIKTRLHELTPYEKTLFLDADSLVYNSIDEYWNYLGNNPYVYEGAKLTEGYWYFNIQEVCQKLSLPWLPKFNSGMILFNKCEQAKQIFDTAYYYFINHKKEGIEIPYFRGNNFPDEPSLSIALAKNNIEPTEDHGCFSRSLIKAKNINLNITKKIAKFNKNGKIVNPFVVHFCGRRNILYYLQEKLRLLLYFS